MKIKKTLPLNQWAGGTLLAGLTLVGLPALAQDVESLDNGIATPAPQQPVDATQPSSRLPITASLGASEQFNGSIDKGGDFSLTRVKLGVGVPVKLNDQVQLGTAFRYEYDHYNFDNTTAPWENINTLALSSVLSWQIDDTWSAYAGGIVKMSAESGAALNRGTTGGGLAGFNYKFDETLSLGAGLAVMGQLEEDTKVLPVITARWKFADNWRLDVGMTDVATAGYGAELKWFFSKEVDFGFGAQFHKSRFRIDAADGVGQEEAATLYADTTWHASSHVDLGAFCGLAVGGKLRVDNSTGTKLIQSDYDPAAILGLKAAVRF